MPFEWLFALSMLNELRNKIQHDLEKQLPKVCGCSEVMVLQQCGLEEVALIAHNEDADMSFERYSYIVKSNVRKEDGRVKTHTAYHYPGTLSGNTFGWNEHLVINTNGKVPTHLLLDGGIARCFLNRCVYESNSIEEAYSLLKKHALLIATGFSTNIATLEKQGKTEDGGFYEMCNIELAPSLDDKKAYISFYQVPVYKGGDGPNHYVHTNHYYHLKGVPEGNAASSHHRYERSLAFKDISNEKQIREFLGDTHDKEFPLYRNQTPPDKGTTLATAIFDIKQKKVVIYEENLITASPIYELKL